VIDTDEDATDKRVPAFRSVNVDIATRIFERLMTDGFVCSDSALLEPTIKRRIRRSSNADRTASTIEGICMLRSEPIVGNKAEISVGTRLWHDVSFLAESGGNMKGLLLLLPAVLACSVMSWSPGPLQFPELPRPGCGFASPGLYHHYRFAGGGNASFG
jgi:hypothetical protein